MPWCARFLACGCEMHAFVFYSFVACLSPWSGLCACVYRYIIPYNVSMCLVASYELLKYPVPVVLLLRPFLSPRHGWATFLIFLTKLSFFLLQNSLQALECIQELADDIWHRKERTSQFSTDGHRFKNISSWFFKKEFVYWIWGRQLKGI